MNSNAENKDAEIHLSDWPRQSVPGEETETLQKLGAIKEPWNKKTKEEASAYINDLLAKVTFYETNVEATAVLKNGADILETEEYIRVKRSEASLLRKQVIEAMEAEVDESEAEIKARQEEIDQAYAQMQTARDQAEETLEKDISTARSQALDEIEAEVTRLENRRQELKTSIAETELRLDELDNRLVVLQERLDEVRNGIVLDYSGYNAYYNPKGLSGELEEETLELLDEAARIVSSGSAVWVVGDNTVPGMEEETLREYGALILNAYNQDIENIIRTLEDALDIIHVLNRAAGALVKANRLGEVFGVCISNDYHDIRLKEIETAFTAKTRAEQEAEEAEIHRGKLRDQEENANEVEISLTKIDEENSVLIRQLEILEAEQRLREDQGDYSDEYASDPDNSPVNRIKARLEELEEFRTRMLSTAKNLNAGYVYVLSNTGAFGKQTVKISMTRSPDPEKRIASLNTGAVPFGYDIHALIYSEKAAVIKHELHRRFANLELNKTNHHKEFFLVDPSEVKKALDEIMDGKPFKFVVDALAEEYNRSLNAPGT